MVYQYFSKANRGGKFERYLQNMILLLHGNEEVKILYVFPNRDQICINVVCLLVRIPCNVDSLVCQYMNFGMSSDLASDFFCLFLCSFHKSEN